MSARAARGWISELPEIVVVVGSGGVGKTTVAAALALASAGGGAGTLVMTFDPSHRLKDSLGLGAKAVAGGADGASVEEHVVAADTAAPLLASLLDARRTFDRLVERYAPDRAARERVLGNRFYRRLGGGLSGILEYMAVERLFEVVASGAHDRVVLDTPPIRNALDFLEAPARIVRFLDSGVRRLAARDWFDARGRLRFGGPMRGRLERLLDDVIGVELIRDMLEFFAAFEPLFDGFRERAGEVERLLRSARTRFVLVVGPGAQRVPEAMFFARRLRERGHRLGPVIANRVLVAGRRPAAGGGDDPGLELLQWLAGAHRRSVEELRELLGPEHPLGLLPLLGREPSDLEGLREIAARLPGCFAGPDAASRK